MLALAGFPATAGFFGKLYLINAAVDNGYAWLGIVIVLGSAVSLAYYLRVVAAVWMRSPSEAPAPLVRAQPVIAGGSSEADASDFETSEPVRRTLRQPEVMFVALACALVTIVFGIYPEPLFNVAKDAGDAIRSLI
jgi:NADH-quinone oxidoreductase subunit N